MVSKGVQGKIEETVREQMNGLDRYTQELFICVLWYTEGKGRNAARYLHKGKLMKLLSKG